MFRKYITILSIVFFMSSIVFLTGCKKDESNPIVSALIGSGKITLNGGGFSNRSVDFYSSVGSHVVSTNSTGVVCYASGTDSLWFSVSFPGTSTGTYNWSAGSTSFASLYLYGSQKTYVSLYNGQTVITKVEADGGKIEGTFSGYVVNAVGTDSINVSGNFSATRYDFGHK